MQALKKLIRFSVKNLKQKSTFLHETDKFWIEKIVDMWVEVSSSFILDQNQHYHIFVELDFYFMMNLVSISFIKFLDIFFYSQKKTLTYCAQFQKCEWNQLCYLWNLSFMTSYNKLIKSLFRIHLIFHCNWLQHSR